MQKYIPFVKKVLQHELISGTTYMFVGAMVANICGFLFNLLLARHLSTEEYGIYGSLLALVTIVTILPQSFSTTIMKFSSEYFLENNTGKVAALLRESIKIFSISGLFFIVLSLLFSHELSSFLHVNNVFLIIVAGIIIGLYFINTIPTNFLQGKLQFGFVSYIIAGSGIAKLLCGILFVLAGWGVFGAFGGIGVSVALAFLIGMVSLWSLFQEKEKKISLNYKNIFLYALPASLAAICLIFYISIDLLLIKHFFSSQDAGLYAGLGFIGKAIFYFTGSIPLVMFPLLVKRHKKNENIHKLFCLSLLLVIIPSLCVTLFYFVFPHFFISLFLGNKVYLGITPYLGVYSLFITAYSVLNILVNFFISLQRTKIVIILIFGAIIQIMGISFFHKSFYEVIIVSLLLTLLLIASLLLYYVKLYGRKTTSLIDNSRI